MGDILETIDQLANMVQLAAGPYNVFGQEIRDELTGIVNRVLNPGLGEMMTDIDTDVAYYFEDLRTVKIIYAMIRGSEFGESERDRLRDYAKALYAWATEMELITTLYAWREYDSRCTIE